MTTGEKIKTMRKKHGMTLVQLAEQLGVSASAISQYERGKLIPTRQVLSKFADIFQCELDELQGNEARISLRKPASLRFTPEFLDSIFGEYDPLSRKKEEIITMLDCFNQLGLDRIAQYINDLRKIDEFVAENVNSDGKTCNAGT